MAAFRYQLMLLPILLVWFYFTWPCLFLHPRCFCIGYHNFCKVYMLVVGDIEIFNMIWEKYHNTTLCMIFPIWWYLENKLFHTWCSQLIHLCLNKQQHQVKYFCTKDCLYLMSFKCFEIYSLTKRCPYMTRLLWNI